jgi:hypothetical protein
LKEIRVNVYPHFDEIAGIKDKKNSRCKQDGSSIHRISYRTHAFSKLGF